MALSEETILQQINVLTTKTSENAEMIYKAIPAINKGLNPDYFSGNETKIVNAINKLAVDVDSLNTAVINMIEKVNSILLNTISEDNKQIWEETQELMGETTIIEGIKAILEGKKQQEILQLHPADNEKILSVKVNQDGVPEVKPVSIESLTVEVGAYDVAYLNRDMKGVTSIGEAVDMICENNATNIGIDDEKLILTNTKNEELASVPIINDSDIDNMIASLD